VSNDSTLSTARRKRSRGSIAIGPGAPVEDAPTAKPPASAATPMPRRPSVGFSLTGLIYCGMLLFMGLAAINSQVSLLFGVFGLMIGILLVSGIVSRLVLARLRVHRVMPEYASVGEGVAIQYEFINGKRFWPSLSVFASELEGSEAFTRQPQAYMLHAAAGMTAMVSVEITPKRRGLHRLNAYQLCTSFPFGFIRRAICKNEYETILVYPPIGSVSPRLLTMLRSAERSGANMKPRLGGSDEFFGVKEYRSGENPRLIHWKRTARAGELIVKEMSQISPPKLLVLVDTYVASNDPAEALAVEKSIAMAATLANHAVESGMSVGLCAWSDGWKIMPAQRGKRHCRDILATLAALPPNQTANLELLNQQSIGLLQSGVTPVLFTPRKFVLGRSEQARGGMIVVPAESDQAKLWFNFPKNIDFANCVPLEGKPVEKESGK
jgi:uncharacterized protein (DUF58 family)